MAVLLLAVLLAHAGALLLYQRSAVSAADETFAARLATQLSLAREAVMRRSLDEREKEARALSLPHFEIAWATTPITRSEETGSPFLWRLRNRVAALAPTLASAELVFGLEGPGDGLDFDELKGTLALPDGTFLNFRSAHSPALVRLGPWALMSTVVATLVGLAAVLLVHRLATPLRELARLTGEIGRGTPVPVPESGPDETRSIAQALNAMQERIHRLVSERTQALAAVSHDLRTPITRLRLRLEGVGDAGSRQAMAGDLDDMQAMIDSTLAYLRGESEPEAAQSTNVASLLLSLVDDAADAGRPVTYAGPSRALARVRPVALKRALANLIDNAVRYGSSAWVEVKVEERGLRIRIDDEGPGIADEDLARVFEPFERLDASRNSNTGGTGLGLTIARRAIEREGGTIQLVNKPGGGLRAEVELPRMGLEAANTLCHKPEA